MSVKLCQYDCQSFKGLAVISLLLYSQLSWANEPESLPDPTISTNEKLRSTFISPMPNKKNRAANDDVQDPTNMNENFRAALNRLTQTKSATKTTTNLPVTIAPSFPDIKLLALACEHHKDKNHAMISINGKSQMLGVGEKSTTLLNNRIFEIEVLDIDKTHVRLRLQPNNDIIILR